ncbi:MAG TPA: prepilin peptidase [Actinomycetota bacterium]
MSAIIGVAAGLGGLLFGSFANVVIHRVPRKESVVRPGSRCGSCGAPIAPRDNIPVVSWILLRGRCRSCGAGISIRYPVVEALTAAAFALAAILIEPATDLIAYLPLLWVLIVLSAIDLDLKILPNRIVVPSLAAGVVLVGVAALLGPGVGAWVRALLASAVSFGAFTILVLISPRGMGMGDVKLAAVLGLAMGYLGWARVFAGFFVAFAAGAIGGVLLLLGRRAGLKSQIPFGPYLALGTVVSVLWGQGIVDLWLGSQAL